MRNGYSKMNIRFRMLCVISLALIVSTVVLSGVIAWNEGMALKDSQEASGKSLATFIAKLSKDPLVMKDGIQLDAIVNEATKDEIVYTLILDERDRILTSQYASINYRSPRFTATLSGLPRDTELPEIIEAIKKKESISEISVPVLFDFMPIGKVTIGISDYGIRRQIEKSILFVIAINLAVALVLGVVLFIASRKIVLDPISELARATSTLGGGDLSVRVNVETSGEIRSLVDSFNQMLGNLEKATVSKEHMDKIIDGMIDTLIVVSGDRRILLANSAALALLGYEEAELAGQPFHIVMGDGPEKCERIMGEILSKGCIGNLEAEYRTKDGRRLSMLFSGSTMPGKHNATEIVCVAKDITKIRELEEELQKLRKLESVGVLAGGIAHDFNNLLQGVFGYISMAGISIDDREKALDALGKAEKALNTAVSLTGQLLTFSMGGKPVMKRIALPSLIGNSVNFSMSGSRSDSRIAIATGLWQVDADPGQIGQVIQNIVINAREAMPGGGTVEISAGNVDLSVGDNPSLPEGGKFVRISIADSGTGIPEKHRSRIFEPYYTTKPKGSGLGLATSYSIVRNHGGMIDVKSEADKGSTFSIYLPAREAGEEPQEESRADAAAPGRRGRILIMDDEALVRDVATGLVDALGHEVECAENGEVAIEKFRQARSSGKPFDVVILDLTIRGGMGGAEAIGKLREIDPDVAAIVSTGYSDNPVVSEYRSYGFSTYLNKPYTIHSLKESLDSLLGRGEDQPAA
jgi:two-component system cell cycle sensor histidine kinase/response regulator CckA